MGRSREWARVGIVVVSAAYLALALLYSLATPIFEAPDELWHFLVLRQIADHHVLPIQSGLTANNLGRQEDGQPPLYYLIGALYLSAIAPGDRKPIASVDDAAELNPFAQPGEPLTPENRNVVFHTPDEAFPYSGIAREVHLLRLYSIALGLATILATYAITLELATGWLPSARKVALGAAALNASIPQFLFVSGSINNDNLAIALSAWSLLAIVQMLKARDRLEPWRWAILGAFIGAAALSKLSCLALLPMPIGAALLLAPRPDWRKVLRPLAFFLAIIVVLAGWWYIRNLWLYGDVTGLNAWLGVISKRSGAYTAADLGSDAVRIWLSFWALFGWSNLPADGYVYGVFAALTLLAALGWLTLWLRRGALPLQVKSGVIVLAAYALLLLLSLARWHSLTTAPEGRLLFPGLAGLVALLSLGLAALLTARRGVQLEASIGSGRAAHPTPRRVLPLEAPSIHGSPSRFTWAQQTGVFVAVLGLFLNAAIIPSRSIAPAYALPAAPAWPTPGVHEVHAIFGGNLELVGFRLEEGQLRPGRIAHFTVRWQRLDAIQQQLKFFVQVLDKTGQRVGGIDSYAFNGIYPAHLWPLGQPVYEVYEIPIADDAAAPGAATILVGVYDAGDGDKIVARSIKGDDLGPTPVVGRLKLALATTIAAPSPLPASTLADTVALIGSSLPARNARPGTTLTGRLQWSALRPLTQDYVVFVQLIGPAGLVAQYDSQPDSGAYPTSLWDPGELITDTFSLSLSSATPPGTYTLIAGMYDPITGQRLSSATSDHLELAQIRVVP